MAQNTIVREAARAGKTEVEYVRELVRAHGGIRPAARKLNVRPRAIEYWIQKGRKEDESGRRS
jgi:hypothetical protein